MSLTEKQFQKARRLKAGERSYANIAIAVDSTTEEVKDALVPGWRENPCRNGRYAKRGINNAEL